MFCAHCGSKVISPDARFCPNCGGELNIANKDESEHQARIFAPKNQRSVPLEPTRFGEILLVLLVVASIGIYAAALIPAFAGIRPSSQGNIVGPFLGWNAILFYNLFRRKNKKGWNGAIAGFVLGFVVLVTAEVVAKIKQNDPSYILSHSPEFIAIQKYDPAMFQRMKTEMEDLAKKPDTTQQVLLSKLAPMMTETLQKALTQTTDEAIVQLARRKVATLEKVANVSENDCSAIFSKQVNPDIEARLVTYIPEQDQKEISIATVSVIENAAGRPQQSLNDSARLDRLMAPIELKMHASGLSIKYLISDTPELTPKKRCDSGIHLFHEALNLNDPDRAYLLRMLLTQWL